MANGHSSRSPTAAMHRWAAHRLTRILCCARGEPPMRAVRAASGRGILRVTFRTELHRLPGARDGPLLRHRNAHSLLMQPYPCAGRHAACGRATPGVAKLQHDPGCGGHSRSPSPAPRFSRRRLRPRQTCSACRMAKRSRRWLPHQVAGQHEPPPQPSLRRRALAPRARSRRRRRASSPPCMPISAAPPGSSSTALRSATARGRQRGPCDRTGAWWRR